MTSRLNPTPKPATGSAGPFGPVPRDRVLTRAVLLATVPDTTGRPAAALRWEDTTLLGRLLGQLAALGVDEAHVLTRPAWAAELEPLLRDSPVAAHLRLCADLAGDMRAVAELAGAGAGAGALVIANAEVLTQQEALAGLLADPRIATGILATRRRVSRFVAFGTQSRRGLIVRAGSPYHGIQQTTERFLGVLKVADAHRGELVGVAERVAGVLDGRLPDRWRRANEHRAGQWKQALHRRSLLSLDDEQDGVDDDEPAPADVELSPEHDTVLRARVAAAREDAPSLLLQGLVTDAVPVGIGLLRHLFWARPLSLEEVSRATSRIGDHDEEQALLDSAVKPSDGFFTTFFVSPYSKYIARWAARRGWTPNAVTALSMAVGVVAAAAFATGERAGLVAGAVLLQIAFTLDCVDGQLARYTRTFSRFGAWLDSIFDRGKEYAVYAGLAIGAASTGDDVWLLAGAALTLQTVRHAMDFTFNTAQDQSVGSVLHQPLYRRTVPLREPKGAREHAARGTWIRRVIVLPIGERFAVISLTAALFDARVTFVVLLAWGGFAAVYTGIGRVLRSLGRRGDTSLVAGAGSAPGPLAAYRDDGPLALALGRVLAPLLPVPPIALAAAAALPLAVAIPVAGAGASWGLVAAVVAWAVLIGGASSGRPLLDRLRWTVSPVLCAIECAGLLWIGAIAGASSVPAAFALVAAIAFRRYDLVYRRRQQATAAPAWLDRAAGGWDGRLVGGLVLAAAGAVPAGLWAAAAALGLLFAGEAIASWSAFDASAKPVMFEDEAGEE